MKIALFLLVAVVAGAAVAFAEVPSEPLGKVERLPEPFGSHWVWVTDLILERTALIDTENDKFLGMINGGYGAITPIFPTKRNEIYLASTYFARRTRGERTDVLEIYDTATLSPVAEVKMPGKRAIDAVALGHQALSDDERFVAVFNWTPRTSLSIVDVENRTFVGEIDIPGCSLVYTAGPRRYFSLCADGSALVVTLDAAGHEASKARTPPFFDPKTDPITEKGVRVGDQWLFASFEGVVHPIDVSGEALKFPEPWPLFSDQDRKDSWRIGGLQHLAAHAQLGRLYSLVHRGGRDSHKDYGSQVWVYDIKRRQRIDRIELRSPGLSVYGFPIEFGREWPSPLNHLSDWLVDTFVPPAVSNIQVTQDAGEPRLLTASQFSGAIGVYDARSGAFVKRVLPTGWTTDLLVAPWGAGR